MRNPRKCKRTNKIYNSQVKPKSDKAEGSNNEESLRRPTDGASKRMFEGDDIFMQIVANMGRSTSPITKATATHSPWDRSRSILHSLSKLQHGFQANSLSIQNVVVDLISRMQLYRTASPFDRRCTAMEWHPLNPNLISVGSKGGDLILWDIHNIQNECFIHGSDTAGSCQALKFLYSDPTKVVTASIDGTIKIHDFHGKMSSVLLDTFNCQDHWYCSVDISIPRKMVLSGDNIGNVDAVSYKGAKIFSKKLHKNKVTHCEFSPREDWMFVTASLDKTVLLWDVRSIKNNKSFLVQLQHDKPINSAYFSLTDGTRLLTTDQQQQIRVYQAPDYHLETSIAHPHRFFRHITPIKASWHPLQDLIVVGHYPDKKFHGYVDNEKRTIDVFDASSGKLVHQLYDPGHTGIVSLNKFSNNGDYLASAMGVNILIWGRMEKVMKEQEELIEKFKKSNHTPSSGRRGGRNPQAQEIKDRINKTKNKKNAQNQSGQQQK